MSLASLPSETLSFILESLAETDLATLLLAQRVCRRFQGAIERILARHHSVDHSATTHPFLQHQFRALFDAEIPARSAGPRDSWIFPGPGTMFRQLPWVASRCRRRNSRHAEASNADMKGSPHLRPEASWRRLSVAWAIGGHEIRNLDVVKVLTSYGGSNCRYAQLNIPPGPGSEAGVLTMGLLYDLLASGLSHFGRKTRGWQLVPGRRLGSYDEWMRLRRSNVYPDVRRIVDLFVEDEESAVLFVRGLKGCTRVAMPARNENLDEEQRMWEPSAIGGVPVVVCPWQGPVLRQR
ncbi:hypothetical protein F5Y13DRAFT_14600 [Hypoxylon sp. FL1857]|nr:hypothetical protein F5Y13DRAFT_14600 [Hypoxylon sp. FL1857]